MGGGVNLPAGGVPGALALPPGPGGHTHSMGAHIRLLPALLWLHPGGCLAAKSDPVHAVGGVSR